MDSFDPAAIDDEEIAALLANLKRKGRKLEFPAACLTHARELPPIVEEVEDLPHDPNMMGFKKGLY